MTAHERGLRTALIAYRAGLPVVVKDEDGEVLHGEDVLACIADLKLPLRALIIDGIPRSAWHAADWPVRLEAARVAFMRGT
jgi:hypothetical protein